MNAAAVIAGVYNANGGIDGRGVGFTDFHPDHALDDDVEIGLQRGSNFDLEAIAAAWGVTQNAASE